MAACAGHGEGGGIQCPECEEAYVETDRVTRNAVASILTLLIQALYQQMAKRLAVGMDKPSTDACPAGLNKLGD